MTTGQDDSATAALVPERTVLGYEVRPWSFGALVKVSPQLEQMLAAADDIGIDLDRLLGKVTGAKGAKQYSPPAAKQGRLVMRCLPQITDLLVNSVEDITPKDIEAMPPGNVLILLIGVFNANMGQVSDFFAAGADVPAAAPQSATTPTNSPAPSNS